MKAMVLTVTGVARTDEILPWTTGRLAPLWKFCYKRSQVSKGMHYEAGEGLLLWVGAAEWEVEQGPDLPPPRTVYKFLKICQAPEGHMLDPVTE